MSATEPTNPFLNGRAYRPLSPSALAELAQHHAGIWRLHVLTEALLAGWTAGTVETLAASGIDLVGCEGLVDAAVPGSPFAGVTGAMGIAVFGFPPLGVSSEAGSHVYAYARRTGSGYGGYPTTTPSDGHTPGALYVAHYGGEDADLSPAAWCEVSHWSINRGRPLLDGDFRFESRPSPEGADQGARYDGTPWHVFGTGLRIGYLDDWVLVRYRNGRYRYLEWLLLMLGLRTRLPDTARRPPSNPGERPYRRWPTDPSRRPSGQFTVNPSLSGQFTVQHREAGGSEYDGLSSLFEEGDLPDLPVGWWDQATLDSIEVFGVSVPYYPTYEQFRENVVRSSPEIRRGMIYRSDPEFPERVIDRRNDLRHVHRGYSGMGLQEGETVHLLGYTFRDPRGYVLLLRFSTPDIHRDVEEEVVTGAVDPDQLIRISVSHSRRVARGISDEQPRRRLLCLLDLADRLGPDQAFDLFTLHPLGTALFIDMSEAWKAELLSSEGLPPDIYKMYPLRNIAYQLYFSPSYREDDARFRDGLLALDNYIYASVHLFAAVLRSGSNVYGRNFYRLRDWVRARQNDNTSIYSCYGGVALE